MSHVGAKVLFCLCSQHGTRYDMGFTSGCASVEYFILICHDIWVDFHDLFKHKGFLITIINVGAHTCTHTCTYS